METKQTAVEWLITHFEKLQKDQEKMTWQQVIDITKLVLKEERQQIVDAVDGFPLSARDLNGNEYYDKVYGNKTEKRC